MQFLYQPLTWGFLLVGVPVLIHLINMLRYRRVQWAAMDFLLESYRRNRRWVLLKQWLLLASRMLIMFLLVMLLAKWLSASQWVSWMGGRTTHHYVLLDDSYSMLEQDQGTTAYERALGAVTGLLRSIAEQPGQHQLTLVRWSRARLAAQSDSEVARLDSAADLLGQSIPQDPSVLLERINATQPSSLALAPEDPLELVVPLVAENDSQQSEVYLVSDMRRNEFGETEQLRNQLENLRENSAGIHIVDCSLESNRNLSLVSIEPEREVWAAGVPLMVRFQVRNRTSQTVKNVVVRLKAVSYVDRFAKPMSDQPFSGQVEDLPPTVIEELAPDETVTRQAQVLFSAPGDHVVEASLEADSLAADNRRWCTIRIADSQRVLLIDGDVRQRNAAFIENVVNPNPNISTGFEVETKDAAYLRDIDPAVLERFDAVAILDVPRIDEQAIEKLQNYCQAGGGVWILAGPNSNLKFLNDSLYREGAGLFPYPVLSIGSTATTRQDELQVTAENHFVFEPLKLLEASPFSLLQIRQFLEVDAPQDAAVEVIARGPGRVPLLVDKAYGRGRSLTLLTGLDTTWSNWAQDPTFVVMALRSLGYLVSFQRPATSVPTGTPIQSVFIGETLLPDAEILAPASSEGGMRVRLQQPLTRTDDVSQSAELRLAVDLDGEQRSLTDTLLRPGVFETWVVNAQGESLVDNAAHNVAAVEGDLSRVTQAELEADLNGIPVDIQSAEAIAKRSGQTLDSANSTLLLLLLAGLLMFEQALAYSASFHASVPGVRA